jgi:hypothetical protein
MDEDDVVEVYLAIDTPQAHFLRNMLGDAGIDARVVGGTVSSSLGLPQGIESSPAVLVHKADEARARALLDEFEKRNARPHRDDEPRPAWKCPACGELVDADFELCWNCQNPRTPY